ncbi:hypothetical protein QJQ45_029771 [Haematococcus lacustris]|nr:hypothetical protein QJQ45_029771 [Haematococcus lacustris]
MADADAVGSVHRSRCSSQAFLTYYYQLWESNRAALGTLYQDQSMLTFEGQKLQGAQAIVAKLQALPFGTCKVNIVSKDFQPSISGGIMVFVTGNMQVRDRSSSRCVCVAQVEGESNAMKFSQVFHLMPFNTSFVVTNDMFRLNYG